MAKILDGIVTSVKMQNTVTVEVSRKIPHPLYGKLLLRSKKYKVDPAGKTVSLGDKVRILEIKPVSKDKYFAISEVIAGNRATKKAEKTEVKQKKEKK